MSHAIVHISGRPEAVCSIADRLLIAGMVTRSASRGTHSHNKTRWFCAHDGGGSAVVLVYIAVGSMASCVLLSLVMGQYCMDFVGGTFFVNVASSTSVGAMAAGTCPCARWTCDNISHGGLTGGGCVGLGAVGVCVTVILRSVSRTASGLVRIQLAPRSLPSVATRFLAVDSVRRTAVPLVLAALLLFVCYGLPMRGFGVLIQAPNGFAGEGLVVAMTTACMIACTIAVVARMLETAENAASATVQMIADYGILIAEVIASGTLLFVPLVLNSLPAPVTT